MVIRKDLADLLKNLRELHKLLRKKSYEQYKRINPFYEDLFDFKERGKFWAGKDNVTIYNSVTISGDVDIGENTWIGPFCTLDGSGGLKIGSFCSIASGCQILTHDTVKWALSGGKAPADRASISIGNYCFIGTYSVISKGVSIGNHCVIGANSFVNKSFADNTIIAGSPARTIGRVIIESDGQITTIYNKPAA